MENNIFSGKLFGHPIHIMIVHFPVAFLPMSLVLDISSLIFKDINLEVFSFYSATAGAALGWVAAIFGAMDLLKIKTGDKAFFTALLHGSLNAAVLIIFTIIVLLQFKYYPQLQIPSSGAIIVKAAAVLGILYTNYLGGELLLRYRIGEIQE